jgi:hypothetical protein
MAMTVVRSHVQQPPVLPAAARRPQLHLRATLWHAFKHALWLGYDLLVPLGIIAAFFWLQVQIAQGMRGVAANLVTIMSVLFELGLVLVWNSLRERVHTICHR